MYNIYIYINTYVYTYIYIYNVKAGLINYGLFLGYPSKTQNLHCILPTQKPRFFHPGLTLYVYIYMYIYIQGWSMHEYAIGVYTYIYIYVFTFREAIDFWICIYTLYTYVPTFIHYQWFFLRQDYQLTLHRSLGCQWP